MTDLLVSGYSADGGLFAVQDGVVGRLDHALSTGVLRTQNAVFRCRYGNGVSSIDRFEEGALVGTFDVPGASTLHSIVEHQGSLIVVDTDSNRVVRLDPATGAVRDQWQPTTVPDAWHMNGLCADGERLVVSIFGRFTETREWWGKGPDRRGELVEVGSGATILDGLAAPHTPMRWNGGWMLCESFASTLVAFADDGTKTHEIVLGGWPRGIAIVDNLAWVGVSGVEREPHALPPHRGTTGQLVAVDLTTWQVVQEIPMPCAGIYDVIAS